jgi:hypothetical protein
MGSCCSCTSRAAEVDEPLVSAAGGGGRALGGGAALQDKREAAARAAESRQSNWRQGGDTDTAKAASLKERRLKDDLIGKIQAHYSSIGESPPFGLAGSPLATLRKHYSTIYAKGK